MSTQFRDDFRLAATELSITISLLFPLAGTNKRKAIVSDTSTGDRGSTSNDTHCNGVEFTGKTWNKRFASEDYKCLPKMVRRLIGVANKIKREGGDPFEFTNDRRGKDRSDRNQSQVDRHEQLDREVERRRQEASDREVAVQAAEEEVFQFVRKKKPDVIPTTEKSNNGTAFGAKRMKKRE